MTNTEQLVRLRELRRNILDALAGSIDAAGLVSYTYTDSDGSQSTTRRNPRDLMSLLDSINKEIRILERQLQGSGIMTFGTNRYGP